MMSHIEKNDLSQGFAQRLRDALLAKQYASSRTPSGVDIHRFAQLCGHSPQICRKYLRGQAIPSSHKLSDIAEKLGVSPGWLLFGDCHSTHSEQTNKITINKDLLHYIFSHISDLYSTEPHHSALRSDFFLELAQDVSKIDADPEQSKKIVDLALFSAKHSAQRTKSNPSTLLNNKNQEEDSNT